MFKKKHDLSSAIAQPFKPDELYRYGYPAASTALAADPVQSILAVGTADGHIYVCGLGGIQAQFVNKTRTPIRHLRFVKGVYLVSIDDLNFITVWALDTLQVWASYQSASGVHSLYTDPALDWLLLGTENGLMSAFDIDRGQITPFRIESLQRQLLPLSRLSPVVGTALHPRDPAQVLLAYREIAAVFSISDNQIVFSCKDEGSTAKIKLAAWHPSGSHIVTCYDNGTMVFWDGRSGTRLSSRSVGETSPTFLAWCCAAEPENTFLLYGQESINVLNFGVTPTVAVTSYEAMGSFFSKPKATEVRLMGRIVAGLPLARDSPYFNYHNPGDLLLSLSSGETEVFSLPTLKRKALYSNLLPPLAAFRASVPTSLSVATISRNHWLGMMASSPKPFFKGGVPSNQPMRKMPTCAVIVEGCEDGSVKLIDGARTDANNARIIQVTIAGIVPDAEHAVSNVSFGSATGELAIAAGSDVYLFTFKKNTHGLDEMRLTESHLQSIAHRSPPSVKEGFMPQWLVRGNSRVSMVHNSNVGFVVIGHDNGRLVVIDRRGPAVIHDETLKEVPTVASVGIEILGGKDYSSLVLAVGTTKGNVHIYELVPSGNGGFATTKIDSWSVGKEPVIQLDHIDLSGKSAAASPEVMAQLARSVQIDGALLAVTSREAKLYDMKATKKTKLGSKSFDTPLLGAGFAFMRAGDSLGLVTVNVAGKCSIYSIPGLAKLTSYPLPYEAAPQGAHVSQLGDVLVDLCPGYSSMIGVWGLGQALVPDAVYNPQVRVPPRPTISTVQWMIGRQFVSIDDLSLMIGGPRRGKSKRVDADLVEKDERPTKPQTASASSARARAGQTSGKMTWGQTFESYYDSAEQSVNNAVEGMTDALDSTRKSTTQSIGKSILRSKLGF